jgi:hypothetical protein
MPLVALALVLVAMLLAIALMPIAIIQRYRLGRSRQRARPWLITINIAGLIVSASLFLVAAAFTNIWVPQAFPYAAVGLLSGCALGVVGLSATRWEPTVNGLYYTPNKWLLLVLTLVVTARLIYGFWRGWQAWQYAAGVASWSAEAGVAGSLAAGAVVLGYYLIYWIGVRRRALRFRNA